MLEHLCQLYGRSLTTPKRKIKVRRTKFSEKKAEKLMQEFCQRNNVKIISPKSLRASSAKRKFNDNLESLSRMRKKLMEG